tara:strand:+ start:279 stop:476 length:198 start_codon:yes stop_codon:yes gene_type:complete
MPQGKGTYGSKRGRPKKKVAKSMDTPYDPSRKGKGGPYPSPAKPSGNPFRTPLAKAKPKRKTKKA